MIWIIGRAIPNFFSIFSPLGRGGIHAIALGVVAFVVKPPSHGTVVHEEIHAKQTMETVVFALPIIAGLAVYFDLVWLAALAPVLAVLFHLIVMYGGLWLLGVMVLTARGESDVGDLAYWLHPMELEAYSNSSYVAGDGRKRPNPKYLAQRRLFGWSKYWGWLAEED